MISFHEDYVEASVHHHFTGKDGEPNYFVKIDFPEIGLYINSFKVMPSPKQKERGYWWVQPPAYPWFGKWRNHIEFSNNSTLWLLIERLAIEAVERYRSDEEVERAAKPKARTNRKAKDEVYEVQDDDLTDDSIEKGIDDYLNKHPP